MRALNTLIAMLVPERLTERARALIALSVERVLARAPDPEAEIRRFGEDRVRHVIDWLVAADASDAAWISRTDTRGRPLKLMKCGGLDRLHKEADRAMRREAQRAIARLDPAKAGEGEILFMDLGGGWTVVELLTPDALDRESARMGHCVGNGTYDDKLAEGRSRFFSLRCATGKPRLTMEIGRRRADFQIRGRANAVPDLETHERIRPLFVFLGEEPRYWLDRAFHVSRGRAHAGERFIAKDPACAYAYACWIIKDRWPEGEPIIATSGEWALRYTRNIIKDRWFEGERILAEDAALAYAYTRDLIGDRWPEAEPTIAREPKWACEYARSLIKGRWPEGEAAIARDGEAAYAYARGIILGRWPPGEVAIAKDAEYAYKYACFVIEDRWLEGEVAIATDSELWGAYEARFVSPDAPAALDL